MRFDGNLQQPTMKRKSCFLGLVPPRWRVISLREFFESWCFWGTDLQGSVLDVFILGSCSFLMLDTSILERHSAKEVQFGEWVTVDTIQIGRCKLQSGEPGWVRVRCYSLEKGHAWGRSGSVERSLLKKSQQFSKTFLTWWRGAPKESEVCYYSDFIESCPATFRTRTSVLLQAIWLNLLLFREMMTKVWTCSHLYLVLRN